MPEPESELPDSTSPPDATPSASPSPPPAPQPEAASTNWAEAYDLDSDFDPELDAPLGAAKPATPAVEAAEAPPAKPRAPDGRFAKPERLVRIGQQIGLTSSQIESMTAAQLRSEIELAEIESRLEQKQQRVETRVAPEPPAPLDWGVDEEGQPLGKDKWHPVLANAIETVHRLEARLAHLEGREVHREQQSFSERCDRFFAEHKDVYGKATYDSLTEDDDEYQLRLDVLAAAQRDRSRHPFEQKLKRAHARLFGTRSPKPDDEPAQGRRIPAEDWDKAALAPATARNGSPEPHGPRRAAKAVNKFFRDRQISLGGDEESSLPDTQ